MLDGDDRDFDLDLNVDIDIDLNVDVVVDLHDDDRRGDGAAGSRGVRDGDGDRWRSGVAGGCGRHAG